MGLGFSDCISLSLSLALPTSFNNKIRIIKKELGSRADQRVVRWFGHTERMDEYRMSRRVLMADVSGGRVRGRPRLGWMDGANVALGGREMTVEPGRQCAKDRKECRELVHM